MKMHANISFCQTLHGLFISTSNHFWLHSWHRIPIEILRASGAPSGPTCLWRGQWPGRAELHPQKLAPDRKRGKESLTDMGSLGNYVGPTWFCTECYPLRKPWLRWRWVSAAAPSKCRLPAFVSAARRQHPGPEAQDPGVCPEGPRTPGSLAGGRKSRIRMES